MYKVLMTYGMECCCWLVIILGSGLWAWQQGIFVHFNPINGAFQTFNPIRRMLAGQHVGKDFFPYLGLGPTVLTTWTTWWLGGHFAASIRASHGLSKMVYLMACWLGLHFALEPLDQDGRRRWRGGLLLACWWFSLWGFGWSKELSTPSNSLLVLRASWLLGLASWLAITTRATPWIAPSLLSPTRHVYMLQDACWLTCSVLWSNDYGLPCAFALLWCRALQESKGAFLIPSLGIQALTMAYTLPLLALGLVWLTDHHPWTYVQSMAGISADQAWYFEGQLWYRVQDVLATPWLWLGLLACSVTLRWWLLTKRPMYLIWHGITLASFAAGMLSCLGGHVQDRYFYPFAMVCLWLFYHGLHRLAPTPLWSKGLLIWVPVISLALGQMGRYPPTAFQTITDMFTTGLHHSCGPHGFAMPALGGCLENRFKALQQTNPLKEQQLWSTYAGFLESVHHTFQPSGIDYIIHALGAPARQRYQRELEDLQPPWISTIAPAYTFWETWIRQKHWPVYQFLWQHYRFDRQIGHLQLWQKREPKRSVQRFLRPCYVERLATASTTLRIWPQLAPPLAIPQGLDHQPMPSSYGVVHMSYTSQGASRWTGAFRHGVRLCDHRLYPLQGCYHLPPGEGQQWSHPLTIDKTPLRSFDLHILPWGSEIELHSCLTEWFVQTNEHHALSSPQPIH